MSSDEYKRIIMQVIQELRDQGWTDEEIADADIRIREVEDPAAPLMVSDIMMDKGVPSRILGPYKH